MIESNYERPSFHRDFEEALTQYPASILLEFYRTYVAPGFEEKIKKAEVIRAIRDLPSGMKACAPCFERMPQPLRAALSQVVWQPSVSLTALEQAAGVPVLRIVPRKDLRAHTLSNYYQMEEDPLFGLIVFTRVPAALYHQKEQQKSSVRALLPPAVRKFFKARMPPPAHYKLLGQPDVKKPAWAHHYQAETALPHDVRFVDDYLRRGAVRRNKDGRLAKASIKECALSLRGDEFFPGLTGQGGPLDGLRTRLFMEFFNRAGNPVFPGKPATLQALGKTLRSMRNLLKESSDFAVEQFLPYIRTRYTYDKSSEAGYRRLLDLFGDLPPGLWVSVENLLDFIIYRELNLEIVPLKYSSAQHVVCDMNLAYYPSDLSVGSPENVIPLVVRPAVHGMAFLLAAFGWLEIVYTPPKATLGYRYARQDYLTPFDGLQAVKLTGTGAFAFGKSEKLTIAFETTEAAELHFHEEELLVRVSSPDPLTRKALQTYLIELTPRLYRLDAARLVEGCADEEEIEVRIEDFRRQLDVTQLPPNWEAALGKLIDRRHQVVEESDLVVYSLAHSPALKRQFAHDPFLRENSLKVEGERVAIPLQKVAAIQQRLSRLGCGL